MARVIYTEQAFQDLERLAQFLIDEAPEQAEATAELIISAVETLAAHPYIGHPAESGLRELVISRGRSGYIALYSLEEQDSIALILGIRHQREAGFTETV